MTLNRSTTLAMLAALTAIMHENSERRTAEREAALPSNWSEDVGKKNTTVKPCGKCTTPFFGRIKRKYCYQCQQVLTRQLTSREADIAAQTPWNTGNRPHRRQE